MNFNMNIIEPVGIRLKCNFAYQRRKKKNFYSREVGTNTWISWKVEWNLQTKTSIENHHRWKKNTKKRSRHVFAFLFCFLFLLRTTTWHKKKRTKRQWKKNNARWIINIRPDEVWLDFLFAAAAAAAAAVRVRVGAEQTQTGAALLGLSRSRSRSRSRRRRRAVADTKKTEFSTELATKMATKLLAAGSCSRIHQVPAHCPSRLIIIKDGHRSSSTLFHFLKQ